MSAAEPGCVRLVAYVLCRPPFNGPETDVERFDRLLNEWVMEAMAFGTEHVLAKGLSLKMVSADSSEGRRVHATRITHTLWVDRVVKVAANVRVAEGPVTDGTGQTVDLSESDLRAFRKSIAEEELRRWVFDVFVAMNLAEIGAAQLLEIVVGRPARPQDAQKMWPHTLEEARAQSDPRGWPPFKPLQLTAVWEWLRHLPGYTEGYSKAPASRAVCALTRLLSVGGAHEELMWALVGLEAMFTSGEVGLMAQMKAKGQAVLGASPIADRTIGKMYQERSAFIHGKRNFGDAFAEQHGWDVDERSDELISEALAVAAGMLVAAIQVLIARGWTGFKFVTNVEGE